MKNITDIILKNEGIIYKIISKYRNYFELDDLYQVAVIGLIKAYEKYDNSYNTKFITYAYPYILGEVIKYINSYRSIKISKTTKMLYLKILKAKEVLAQRLMKEPSTYELSLFLEMEESIIEEVIAANETVDSLDKMIMEDDKNLELYDKVGYMDGRLENYQLKIELDKLTKEEKQIIIARYYEDFSQKEVGEALGMYQVEVSRKEKKILQKLKDSLVT